MQYKDLLDEIRATRDELKKEMKMVESKIDRLGKEFWIFKGKAFGIAAVVTILINIGVQLLK